MSSNICMLNGSINLTAVNLTIGSPPVVGLSTVELWIQLIFFYGFLCGLVSSTCSILVWVGIVRTKQLRTRFFIIVGCLTFCRTGICLQFLCMSVYRSLRTLQIVSTCQRRIVCHTIHFWLIHGWTMEMTLLLVLVIDRVLGIVRPNYYRQLTPKSAFHLCTVVCVIVSFIKLVPSYLSEDMGELAPCVNIYSAPGREFNAYSQDIDLCLVALILICYFGLLIYVDRKVKSMKQRARVGSGNSNDALHTALQRQLRLMPILRNLVLMHCGLALTAKVLLTMGVFVPKQHAQRATAYGGMMSCVDVASNVGMLLVTNAEIRAAALPWLAKKKATVDVRPFVVEERSTVAVAIEVTPEPPKPVSRKPRLMQSFRKMAW